MKVLVTGGAGYIGSHLLRHLLDAGHEVTIIEKFNFGLDSMKDIINHSNLEIVIGDITENGVVEDTLESDDFDAVVHLAAIVGDPACAAKADRAVEVNYLSTLNIARLARDHDVERFVFASTCSVYGEKGDELLTEESELNPVSLYAETKIDAEKGLLSLQEDTFHPVILRLGTVFGMSPRMRFDLVINYLTKKIMLEGEGMIFGGDQYRPFVHVEDAARGFKLALEAPLGDVSGEKINIGDTEKNFNLTKIGGIFEEVFSPEAIQYVEEMEDNRSYRVDFSKAEELLDFDAARGVKEGIAEMKDAIDSNRIANPNASQYYNYNAPDED